MMMVRYVLREDMTSQGDATRKGLSSLAMLPPASWGKIYTDGRNSASRSRGGLATSLGTRCLAASAN